MIIKLISSLALVFAASTSNERVISALDNADLKTFKVEIKNVSKEVLKTLLERVVAESNPEFLNATLASQKYSLNILKENPELIAVCVNESGTVDHLKAINKILPLDKVKLADGKSILHVATEAGSTLQIEFIAQLYPNMINALDNNLESPVSSAARRGSIEIIKTILKIPNAKLNLKNKKGQRAFDIAKSEEFPKTAAEIKKALNRK